MIFHLCLRTSGREASNWLAGSFCQWAVAPGKIILIYFLSRNRFQMLEAGMAGVELSSGNLPIVAQGSEFKIVRPDSSLFISLVIRNDLVH